HSHPPWRVATMDSEKSPTIPLPPPNPAPKAAPDPVAQERYLRRLVRMDAILVGLTLLFAFLVATFAVRNSDFLLRLATGRALLEGKYHFGVDPFTHSSGAYWANHSWLYDVIVYGLYLLIGATGLLVLKALAVAATAEVMLRTSRRLRTLWVPALSAILALLAMSPRLLLQPVVVSYLFLALTLYFLLRPHARRRLDDPAPEKENPAPEPKKGKQKPAGP